MVLPTSLIEIWIPGNLQFINIPNDESRCQKTCVSVVKTKKLEDWKMMLRKQPMIAARINY